MVVKTCKQKMKKPVDPKSNLKNKDFQISIRKQRPEKNEEKRPLTT